MIEWLPLVPLTALCLFAKGSERSAVNVAFGNCSIIAPLSPLLCTRDLA